MDNYNHVGSGLPLETTSNPKGIGGACWGPHPDPADGHTHHCWVCTRGFQGDPNGPLGTQRCPRCQDMASRGEHFGPPWQTGDRWARPTSRR